jgi:subtilase family serine protease/ribosomal protein L40E
MMGRAFTDRAASILIVVSLLLTPFTGMLFLVGTTEGQGALPTEEIYGDRTLGSDYEQSYWNISSAIYQMNGNLTIRAGGVVSIDNGGLKFAQTTGHDGVPYTGDDRIYWLIIEDGGKLILRNSTLTTNLNQLNAFPSLGVIVRNGGAIEAYDSTIKFPGHLVVDDSTLTMWRSSIAGNPQVATYCDPTYFPVEVFSKAPVLLFSSATVNLFDSSLTDIYEWPEGSVDLTDMYSHQYPFVADVNNGSGGRVSVNYDLERMPSGVDSEVDSTVNQVWTNLTTYDQSFYDIATSQTMWLSGIDTAGLVFNNSDAISALLHVEYYTDPSYSGTGHIQLQYANGATVDTGVGLPATENDPNGVPIQETVQIPLPTMSSLDMYGLNIGFNNNGGADVYINRVWITLRFNVESYANVTLMGSTQLTAVNSYIGVDFSDNLLLHNSLVLLDQSMAYLYGVSVNLDQKASHDWLRLPAFVTVDKTITAMPSSIGTNDNSDQLLGNITALDGLQYVIQPTKRMEIDAFNTSDITGPISGAVLSVTYRTDTGYVENNYIQWMKDNKLTNTSIKPILSESINRQGSFDLYAYGETTISDIANLDVQYLNEPSVAGLRIDRISVDITLSPSVYIYRWANYTVVDSQGLPVSDAEIWAKLQNTSQQAVYYTPEGVQNAPADDVLDYLGRDATTYNVTDVKGRAAVPYLSEIIDQWSPNPYVAFSYRVNVTYTNISGVSFTNMTGVSFSPYPDLSSASMWLTKLVRLDSLVQDLPDLYVVSLTPVGTPYEGDIAQVVAVIGNRGRTTATNVRVNITGYANGTTPGFYYEKVIDALAADDTYTITVNWASVPYGNHIMAVSIDPAREIVEEKRNNNGMSVAVPVLQNLPDLSISSDDISFNPQPAKTDAPVEANILVYNLGRASAQNVLIEVYAGEKDAGGVLVAFTRVTVATGLGPTLATASWLPTMIGTYPIYVYVNGDRAVLETNYDDEAASHSITVDLAVDEGSDLLVDGSVDHPSLTFTGGAPFNWPANIIITDDGSITLDHFSLNVVQSGDYVKQILVNGSGSLILTGSSVLSSNHALRLSVMDNGALSVTGSALGSSVSLELDNNAAVTVNDGRILGDVKARTTSNAVLTAVDSTFGSPWSSFGGHSKAYLTNVDAPSLVARENAAIYHYRYLAVAVVDRIGYPIAGADVTIRHILNTPSMTQTGVTGTDGKAVFTALCDEITAGNTRFWGDYVVDATYTSGTTYTSDGPVTMSLTMYSSPLQRVTDQATVMMSSVRLSENVPTGDIVVKDDEVLELTGSVAVAGNITVMDNGELILDAATLTVLQTKSNQFAIRVLDNGVLTVRNGSALSTVYLLTLTVMDDAKLNLERSTVASSITIQMSSGTELDAESASIGGLLQTMTGSDVYISAVNSTINSLVLSGTTHADLTSVGLSLTLLESATVSHYRWIAVTVKDGTGYILPGATVNLYTTQGYAFVDSEVSNAAGVALFRVLCDQITTSSYVYTGSYSVQAVYVYHSVSYTSSMLSLASFAPFNGPSVTRADLSSSLPIESALPDLDPPIHAVPSEAYRGDTVVVSTTIFNNGVVAAHNVLVLFNNSGVTFWTQMITEIGPGEHVDLQANWVAAYPLGQHNISLIVDPYRRISELNEADNSNYTLVNVLGVAELSIVQSDVDLSPSAVTNGTLVSVTPTVRNNGDVSAEDVDVSVYVTAPNNGTRYLIGTQSIPYIGSGSSGSVTISWTPIFSGDYVLDIIIDEGRLVTNEKDYSNNEVSFTKHVLNYPDLRPSTITFSPGSSVPVDTNVVISAVVTNAGESAAGGFTVVFHLGSIDGEVIRTVDVESLASGASVTVTTSWYSFLDPGLPNEDWAIYVDVNPARTVVETESGYANNIAHQTIRVYEVRPDLMFPGNVNVTRDGSAVTAAAVGETIVIKTTVSNAGTTIASGAIIEFYAVDAYNNVIEIGSVTKTIGPGVSIEVSCSWVVDAAMALGDSLLVVNANPTGTIIESNASNDQVSVAFTVEAPNLKITFKEDMSRKTLNPGTTALVIGTVINKNSTLPAANTEVTLFFMKDNAVVGQSFNGTTDKNGQFMIGIYVPPTADGQYELHATTEVGDKIGQTTSSVQIKAVDESGVPWWIYLLILAIVSAVIIGFSAYLYKYGLGKMVECGECGALIPESSKHCPKCGVEFEAGTAKCSDCGAWIPSNSTACPECGAKFLTEAIIEEEDAYVKKMREQYESYVDIFREEAKKDLGKKYSDAKFPDWWKKQPSYISFENWVTQEENKRKAGGQACPVCGTLNPRGATICHKCGSIIELPKAPEVPGKNEEKPRPLRRIVRRPVEKKTEAPKAPETEVPPEVPEEKPVEEEIKPPAEDEKKTE